MSSTPGFAGKVELNGKPVEGAEVFLLNGQNHGVEHYTTTDANGFYKFPNLD